MKGSKIPKHSSKNRKGLWMKVDSSEGITKEEILEMSISKMDYSALPEPKRASIKPDKLRKKLKE